MSISQKCEKVSISLPCGLIAVIDQFEANRSSYIQRLVTSDLRAAGRLPGSLELEVMAEVRDLLRAVGAARVRELIQGRATV